MALVSRWQLNEKEGATATDSVGGRNGTYNGPTLNQAGIVPAFPSDGCPSFDGANDRVEVADHSSLRFTTALTLKAWIRYEGDKGFVISKGEEDFYLYVHDDGSIELGFVDSGGTLRSVEAPAATLVSGTNYCIHATHEQNVETRIYVNGVQKATAKLNFAARTSTKALWIGMDLGSSAEYHLKGKLARVEAHNSRLTAEQVLADYTADNTAPGKAVEGKAAGTGTGTGSAKGTRSRLGKGSGSGTGSGSAKGTRERKGSGTGTGSGSGSGAGTRSRVGKASGSGAGAGSGKGTRSRKGQATGSGVGSGAAVGSVQQPEGRRVAVTREYPPDNLAIRVSPSGGAPVRFAEDERLTENVIEEIKTSGELNGGEKEASWSLARDPRETHPDLPAFAPTEVYAQGGEPVWSGRIDKAPENDGERKSVDPAAVGHKAALEDNRAVIAGFIDGDLGKWGEPSLQRKAALLAAGVDYQFNANVSTGRQGEAGELPPGIAVEFTTKVEGRKPIGESWFYGGGVELGSVMMGQFRSLAGASENATFDDFLFLASDDLGTAQDLSSDFNQKTTSGPITVSAGGAGRRWAGVSAQYNSSTGAFDFSNNVHAFLDLRVIGNHGLTLQGTWPEVGFTAKQMLAYLVPQFSYLEVDESEMEDDGFVIPQAWFSDPTTLLAIIQELTKYGLLDWFVRGNKFHYRKPGTYGRRWNLYAGPSALKEQGLDASRLWRSIVVRWQDVDGTTWTYGPPGSGARLTSPNLEITDPDHPAVRANMTRQDILDLGGIGVAAQALATGERWLEEANLLSRSGSCTASYYAMDDKGIPWPVSRIREGDLVRFPDGSDQGWRKVQSYEYTHSSRSNSLALDAPKESIVALLERYNAKLTALGIS